MKSILTGVICTSLVALSGCDNQTQNQTVANTVGQSAAVTQVKTESPVQTAIKSTLQSGIVLSNMDKSVHPQDDFYDYMNGTWQKNTEIPTDKTTIGAFYDLRDKSDEDVKAIILEASKDKDAAKGTNEQKIGDLYRSFMNTDQLDKLGIKPIAPMLAEIDALKNKDDLATLFAEGEIHGVASPLGFYISIDDKDSTRYATHIWQSGLGLPDKDYYFNDGERFKKIRAAYVEHIEKMFSLAGFKDPKKSAQTIMDLETKLATHHWSRVQTRDSEKRYNKFNVADLNKLTDKFNWTNYLKTQGVANEPTIIINQPDYIQGFGEVFAATSLQDWKTYTRWNLLNASASYLSGPLDAQNFDFYSKTLNGAQEQKPRWKRAVSVVNGNLGEVIGQLYVAKHFTPEAKSRMSQLVENLRGSYADSIDSLDWMSEETKEAAKAKLAAFTPKIGYPDKWEDYSALSIDSGDLVGNINRSLEVNQQKQLAKLGGPIHKWEWGMTPQTVNAYYNPSQNEIVFPAAILQPPFFNMEADDAVNYGGIGAVIGHEMGHGFDDQGSKYDGDGNLKNWWTEKDLEAFKARTASLVKQYSEFKVFDDLNVNGELTLGENIGDLSGITIAYRAYKKSLNGQEAPVIDGLTGDQRFFLGFAQIWRGKMRDEALRNQVATNPHSPGHFRAIGALKNMPQFYQAFEVKEGDKMYIAPENRVKIW
ncbi:MAG: peptidase M13 [Gammaproteobacteria bacterium CG22_combo_CG10-13_8_21_14_all_40_8]|nr:MAG: peptidase M13 [Gammaproteobacteria bacterium CG22_combo_CG10-13_8_21_14_all_40_8]